ncbi:hypothetical protein [Microbacterium sp. NPDC087592]|uniref:hypothetical protein n=1 Tax=Microbacterium sp. NPDC087592 TaxID=3364193 RepID=UPI0038277AE6
MRVRPLVLVGLVAVLVLTGCSPTPEESPTPTASSVPTPSPTPTPEPIVAPDAAFDVTCADVADAVENLLGTSVGAVEDVLGVTSSPNWHPGPAQHMMQRAGGIGCSAGDAEQFDPDSAPADHWSIAIVPDAQALIDGAVERGAGDAGTEGVYCQEGSCIFTLRESDILLTGSVWSPGLAEGSGDGVRGAMAGLLASAADSVRDFEYGESKIAGVRCETLLTAEEVAEHLGTHTEIVDFTRLGGWGIPAEVYYVKDGGQYCMYAEGQDVYNDATFVSITTLPAGAWAFENLESGSAVEVAGADAALAGVDYYGQSILDVRVGLDWLRFATPAEQDDSAMIPLAEMAIEHFTRGRPAPQ